MRQQQHADPVLLEAAFRSAAVCSLVLLVLSGSFSESVSVGARGGHSARPAPREEGGRIPTGLLGLFGLRRPEGRRKPQRVSKNQDPSTCKRGGSGGVHSPPEKIFAENAFFP
jgi:hypothetical protein